ncbi:MAG: S9 family peptidase [bacterium]|nr:S9 family peptidase [bacterium]
MRISILSTWSVLWILLACGISVGLAQQTMQPADVARLRAVTNAAIAPDGKLIAYTLSVPRRPLEDDDGPAWSHLYVVDAAGKARVFVAGQETVGSVSWMPDGSSLLYLAKRGQEENASLYQIPIDGGESVRILEHDTAIQAYSIHPDGKQVAFLATEKLGEEISSLRDQGFDQEVFEEDWLATKCWVTTLEADAQPRQLDLPGSASQVHWNHAGTKLAIVLAPTPSVDDSYMAKQVCIVDVEDGSILAKVEHCAKLGEVRWSPDDEHLALVAGADIHDPKDGRLLVAAASDGFQVRDVLPEYDAHVTSFQWQNEGTLLWTADEGTWTRVGSVSLDGKRTTLVAPGEGQPILAGISVSQDGKQIAMVGHAASFEHEVFVFDLASKSPQRISNSNPWLDEKVLARQTTISWTAADGLTLQGVLVYPKDYVDGERYPMIMVVHGGPEAHESDGWMTSYSRPGQVAAARGFFVFYPNYRGSTGRGVEFSKLGQADAAGKEFSDLVDAIDHLVHQGLVDKDRVGITGGSYGGYASAWAATFYSERYAASVMFVGISDNISKVGTTDIPEEMFLVHHRKRLWEDWDYFAQSSPIRYVERNRTPTLILHGKEDPRVHPSQSLELHRHLKTLGQAPVRLVLYEGEGHGNRKAAARLDYSLRQLRWMEHYLKGAGGAPPSLRVDYHEALGIDKTDEQTD